MSIISYFTVVILEFGVVLSQVLDLLDEVVLVCFGMGLVDASKLACSTSPANIWSGTVTLEKKKQARKLAFAQTKTYARCACPVVQASSGGMRWSLHTFCLAVLQGVQAIVDTLPAVRRLR